MNSNFKIKTWIFYQRIKSRFISLVGYYLCTSNKKQIKFLIFTQRRTGSSLLQSLLNSHQQIKCEGEILSPSRIIPIKFHNIENVIIGGRANWNRNYAFGFKVVYDDILARFNQNEIKSFIKKLVNKYNCKIIFLIRNNYFEQALSNIIAEYNFKYVVLKNEKVKLKKVELEKNKLLNLMTKIKQQNQEIKSTLKDLKYIEICYEKDLKDSKKHQNTANILFDYLEIPKQTVYSNLSKINKGKISDLIINHEEVTQWLKDSEYQKFV